MKRMKKSKILFIPVVLFLLFSLCLPITALEAEENAQAAFAEIYASVDTDTRAALEQLGLENINYESLLALSPRAVITELFDLITGKMAEPLRALGVVCAFLALQAILSSFLQEKGELQTAFSLLSTLFITVTLLLPVSQSMAAAFSAMQLSANFMLTYIPAFAGVIAMSGKPLTSAAYSSVMVGTSNLLSGLNFHVLLPVIQVFFLFQLLSAMQEKQSFTGLTSFLKKAVQIILGFSATVFTGLLTLKGALASSGDSVSVKGVKMLVGSAVPIVGGALSEGYTTVLGSIALIKNTIGVFGILVIALMQIPVIIDLLLWYIGIYFTAAIAELFGQTQVKKLLDGMASTVSLVNTLVIFTAFLWIVSTGIILQFRG